MSKVRRAVVPVLHAITTDEIVARTDFVSRAYAFMRALGARGAVHLRAPKAPARVLVDLARALAALQAETGCWLTIGDRVDVALAVSARGVQLTSRSMDVADAVRVAPFLAVGASVHDETDAALAAGAGAAWGILPRDGVSLATTVRQVTARVAMPLLVIGGVTPRDVAGLIREGAHGVAVVRGVWETSDTESAARDYLSAHDAEGTSQR